METGSAGEQPVRDSTDDRRNVNAMDDSTKSSIDILEVIMP
jgi:hypothetical protein